MATRREMLEKIDAEIKEAQQLPAWSFDYREAMQDIDEELSMKKVDDTDSPASIDTTNGVTSEATEATEATEAQDTRFFTGKGKLFVKSLDSQKEVPVGHCSFSIGTTKEKSLDVEPTPKELLSMAVEHCPDSKEDSVEVKPSIDDLLKGVHAKNKERFREMYSAFIHELPLTYAEFKKIANRYYIGEKNISDRFLKRIMTTKLVGNGFIAWSGKAKDPVRWV